MSFADQLKSVQLRSINRPKEKANEQLLCPDSETYHEMMNQTKFENYYHFIKEYTFPSITIPLNKSQIDALHQGHEHFKKCLIDNDDLKTDECFQMYPELLNLSNIIDSCSIKRPIFVRLSTRSPKDAVLLLNKDKFRLLFNKKLNEIQSDQTSKRNRRLIALDKTSIRLLAANNGCHAIQILLASERIQDDLQTHSKLDLIVRQYIDDEQCLISEFRAFIFKRKLTSLTQYNEFIFDKYLLENKNNILKSIKDFFQNENLLERIPYENCALDLMLKKSNENYQIFVCEINPLAEFTGTGLFSWLNDRDILEGRQHFEFRIRENENFDANTQWLSLIKEF